MPASVKRVSKSSSNKKSARPKQEGPGKSRKTAAETVGSMTADVNATARTAGDTPVVGRAVFGASCTIHEAPALRTQLLALAAHPGPYELDGSAVQQIDTAGVQLVVAFALDCLERSIHYTWTGRSAALEDAIRTLGVGALLESPGAATPYAVGAA
jgi:anti-anti-sigma regulatory factor